MTFRDAIEALPPGSSVTLPREELLKLLGPGDGDSVLITTTEAATRLGFSAKQWQRWAVAGAIAGAFQKVLGGPWSLPLAAAKAHVGTLRRTGATRAATRPSGSSSTFRRPLPRGPRQKTPPVAGDAAGALQLHAGR
jgi:hypothetical protein